MAVQYEKTGIGWWWPENTEPAPSLIHLFIIKIASRCNLDCPYCYVYHLADKRWINQPKFMSSETILMAVKRIKEYVLKNNIESIGIVFHGGEPLLSGYDRFTMYCETIVNELTSVTKVSLAIQTNGTLLDNKYIEIAKKYNIVIGISMDGPPEINDQSRFDHSGKGSSVSIEKALLLLEKEQAIFGGILAVINVETSPLAIYEYFKRKNIENFNFLLPDGNHSKFPPHINEEKDTILYSNWLKILFDRWYNDNEGRRPNITMFSSIIRLLFGGKSLLEAVGIAPNSLLIIETNGELEGLDALKSCYNGASFTGMSVYKNSIEEAAWSPSLRTANLLKKSLCSTCQNCKYVDVCGGGYLPNRYNDNNGFLNPTIYCYAMKDLIQHIVFRVKRDLELAGAEIPTSINILADYEL